MNNNKFSTADSYPYDTDGEYERQLISDCVSVSTDKYNLLHSLHTANNLTIMHLNCCSLSAKFDLFQVFLSNLSVLPDVFCLTESCTTSNDMFFSLQQYNMLNFPYGSRGGGIVIYVKNNIEVSCQVIDVNVSTFEFSCVRLGPDKSSITLLCLYRPPSTDKDVFCTELENLVNLLPSAPNNLIICGDYNIDALVDSNHFTTLVSTHLINNAYPVIFHPTRVTPSSVTLIDHTFCNFESIISFGVLTEKISGHYITFINVKSPLNDSVEHNTPIYKLSRPINNRIKICANKSYEI